MQSSSTLADNRARWMMPALLGFVFGNAVQLQQRALYVWQVYAGLLTGALAVLAWMVSGSRATAGRRPLFALLCASAGFGAVGWRAAVFQGDALAPAIEGRDIVVTGVVAAMPQVNEAGTRFRFTVEQATQAGTEVRLPPVIYLGWYSSAAGVSAGDESPQAQRQPSAVRAGER